MVTDDLLVGLDIGTTKVCAVIGSARENGDLNVIGVGSAPTNDGVRKGAIVDIDRTVDAITAAVEEAERTAGTGVEYVYVGISGAHITSVNSQGIVAIKGNSREITDEDVERAVENAKTAVSIPTHQQIIHTLPREFVVDEQKEISNPVGMVGSRLEAQVHIISGAITAVQNIMKSCEMANLKIHEVVLQPYASSLAVLSEDEMKLGVVMIDIGGGTSDLMIFQNGHVVHSFCAPFGGHYVTNDIAVMLKTGTQTAETLKTTYGVARADLADTGRQLEVVGPGGEKPKKPVTQKDLAEIIEPRMEEMFNELKEQIIKHVSPEMIPAGVVLTGGTALMNGCPELAEEILGLSVRRGYPQHVTGLKEKINSPMYSTAAGLIRFGMKYYPTHVPENGILGGLGDRFRGLLRKFFGT